MRYQNVAADGEPLLAVDGVTQFPFRWIATLRLLERDDFTADVLDALLMRRDLAYDGASVVGVCDTDKMPGGTSDAFCAPGTASMPDGNVIAVLYHPETHAIAAITTGVSNVDGEAVNYGVEPEPQPPTTCGPYQHNQWITAAEYQASGLNLPVKDDNAGRPITDYRCVVPQAGNPYLQAYSLTSPANGNPGNGGNGGNGGKGGNGGDGGNGGNGSNGGPTEPPLDLN